MKYVILVGDGMADYPLEQLDGKTPLQVAQKPNMDWVAKNGKCGLLKTVPEGMKPGSDVANLSLMGYDPKKYFPGGRGPIEAAVMGVKVGPKDLAIRCNIITEEDGLIKDYSGGKISNEDAKTLMEEANKAFGRGGVEFFPGVGYRNLLVLRNCDVEPEDLKFEPPHDHLEEPFEKFLAKGEGKTKETAEMLNDWVLKSKEVFEKNKVNEEKRKRGENLANRVWFWGAGKLVKMPTLKERFGISGVVISGVDLIKGLGVLAGLDVINVKGATAYFDTNYEGKADAALEALKEKDLAFVHVEAPDEAGHDGLIDRKIEAIENIDKRLLDRIIKGLKGEEHKIAVLPDHGTPIKVRTHVSDPVPFAIYNSEEKGDDVEKYDEETVKKGGYGLREGPELVEILFG